MSSDDHATIVDTEKVDLKNQLKPTDDSGTTNLTVDNGLRAWLALVGSFLAQFCAFGSLNAFGIYEDYYVRIYLSNYSASHIGWIGSTQLCIVLLMGIPSGRAFDAGYFYHITIAGSLLFSFSLFMLSLSHPQQFSQVFLAQGLASSFAIGMIYVPSLAILSHHFNRRRPFAMGISAAGAAVGGALQPIMLNRLIHRQGRDNFHNGVRASAAFNLCLLLISVLLMKPRQPPKQQDSSSLPTNLRSFVREPAYVLTALGTLPALVGMSFPMFFLQLYAIKKGVNPKFAFYSLTALNCGSAMGRIVSNIFVDSYGIMNALLLSVLSATVMIFTMLGIKTAAGIIIFGVIYGFFQGAYVSLLGPLVSSMAKKNSEIGARIGICFAVSGIGGLIGNPIAGVFLSSSFEWWKPTLFAGLAVSLAAVCFFSARVFLVKERGTMVV